MIGYRSVSCDMMQFGCHLSNFSIVVVGVAMQRAAYGAALSCALWFHFVCVSRMKGLCVCVLCVRECVRMSVEEGLPFMRLWCVVCFHL